MSVNKYFQDELSALRGLGAEFADANPRLAPFLATEAQDPDVERLLEGFAFLTGRLRQKLEDELPELTHSVMNLLWPNFLKPIPSLSMVQMYPVDGLSEKKQIKRKSMVLSTPVDGTQCQFQTCYDVDLYPIVVSDAHHSIQATGSNITIQLSLLDDKANLEEMSLSALRFHLFGDLQSSHSLYLYFCRYLQEVQISAVDAQGNKIVISSLLNKDVVPVGFSENENLLPYTDNLFNGYRILQEYFALSEKYLFIDFTGLNDLASQLKKNNIDEIVNLEFDCSFSRKFDSSVSINKDSFRLYCTPVVNLFEHKSAPIQLDHKKVDYRLLPSAINPKHYEVYQVKDIEAWGHSDHKRKKYPYFESFEHGLNDTHSQLYYKVSVKESQDGQAIDSYVSFVNQSEQSENLQAETIEANLICTNRNLSIKLGIGDINIPGEGLPEYVDVTNISQVTPEFIPPMDKGFHWQLISNMSLNYQSLMNKEALKIILSTYDYRRYYDRQQARASQHRLDGIDTIKVDLVDRLYQGRPVRGIRSTLRVLESKFTNEGEMFLFFSVLNEFFSLYVSLNSFHELIVHGIEQGEVYSWPARIGQQPII
ncbi:MAG: type VI secretion system baseplate subunit TssF [Gammaproteobacteria bacterium]|nr:type VI secretion system baseplate subunit TssF [Gammaproteobacteria bacterium]